MCAARGDRWFDLSRGAQQALIDKAGDIVGDWEANDVVLGFENEFRERGDNEEAELFVERKCKQS